MTTKTHPTSVQMPAELRDALRREAEIERRSVSFLIVDVMSAWVAKREQDRVAASLQEQT